MCKSDGAQTRVLDFRQAVEKSWEICEVFVSEHQTSSVSVIHSDFTTPHIPSALDGHDTA